jgi:lipoprotein-anchoring transpeptidase ErfK/SrfK
MTTTRFQRTAALAIAFVGLWSASASAQFLSFAPTGPHSSIFGEVLRDGESLRQQDPGENAELPARFRRQIVSYSTSEAPGTIVIDTPNTYLYYVLGGGKAVRYGIGVGREGFAWSGTQTVTRKAEWPDWNPPAEMINRQPYLPRFVAGGPGNPLGARAIYLGSSIYRIHGTNQPHTIGGRVSSGCIRLVNEDVTDLYGRVHVGTKVVVLPIGYRAERRARVAATPVASSNSLERISLQ